VPSNAPLATGQLFYFKLFKAALDDLKQAVTKLAQQHPFEYKSHPKTRLLASVYKCVTQLVRANPDHLDFRLGKTLGKEYVNWRRVKKGMPGRYRLFFRFASSPVQLIVYVLFNDDDTLRKAGSKTDIYEAFRRMLMRGEVPSSINVLLAESQKPQ
jgi:toxin YhaV